jgi:hypothetical protein
MHLHRLCYAHAVNHEAFQDALPGLLLNSAYHYQWVAVHEGALFGPYPSFADALEEALQHWGEGTFIIQEVVDPKERINFIASAL